MSIIVKPEREQIVELIRRSIEKVGSNPDAFEIIAEPFLLASKEAAQGQTEAQWLGVYPAIAKESGLVLFFSVLGEHGINAKISGLVREQLGVEDKEN